MLHHRIRAGKGGKQDERTDWMSDWSVDTKSGVSSGSVRHGRSKRSEFRKCKTWKRQGFP